MMASMRPAVLVLGVATAAMTALAAGALWCIAAAWNESLLAWMALPAGAAIALVLHMQGMAGRGWSAALAALLTVMACAYAQYLLAAVRLAQMLGLPLRNTLFSIGPDFAFSLAFTRIGPFQGLLLGLGVALSALLAWQRKPDQQVSQRPVEQKEKSPK
jgi:hypothetical protein